MVKILVKKRVIIYVIYQIQTEEREKTEKIEPMTKRRSSEIVGGLIDL